MNLPLRIKAAKAQGERIALRLGAAPPFDPVRIAEDEGIMVQAKPAEVEGVSGMLVRHGNSFGILYATHIASPGFQRFSISHELGHYFLPGHPQQVFTSGVHVSRAGSFVQDPVEQEADGFAAGFLMPASSFRSDLRRLDNGLDAILALSERYVASLSATAVRVSELATDPVAIVLSRDGVVEYCAMTEAMKPHARRGWPRRGQSLPGATATDRLCTDRDFVRSGGRDEAQIDLCRWFDGESRVDAREEVMGLGAFGRVLTILTCRARQEDEESDEETDDEVIERWTPRFRR